MLGRLGKIKYIIARIIHKSRLSAVANSDIHPTSAIESGSQVVNTSMDRHSFCGYDCVLLNCDIGSFCSLADQVYIGGSHHPIHFVSTSPVFLSHRDSVKAKFARHNFSHQPLTRIGNDVWIGHGAKIKAGISIGHGAVVGMGSIVTKDVPPYAIVAGNPARIIRSRFPKEIVDGLLKSAWWDGADDALEKMGEICNDPVAFLKQEKIL